MWDKLAAIVESSGNDECNCDDDQRAGQQHRRSELWVDPHLLGETCRDRVRFRFDPLASDASGADTDTSGDERRWNARFQHPTRVAAGCLSFHTCQREEPGGYAGQLCLMA